MFEQSIFFKDLKPLFILGVPRSGTTFLQQIVNTHPEIFLTDELRVVSWLLKEAVKISEGFKIHGNPYPFNNGDKFSKYLLKNCGTLISPYYYQQAKEIGKNSLKYWGDKYPHYHEDLIEISKSFPRASYIFINRDLKDVICSVKNGHKWDIEKSAKYVCNIYVEYINKLEKTVAEGLINPKKIIFVDYFTLNSNIEQESKIIFDKLCLDCSDSCMENIVTLKNIQSHSLRKSGNKMAKFNLENSMGRWQKELTDQEQKVVLQEITKIDSAFESFNSLKMLCYRR